MRFFSQLGRPSRENLRSNKKMAITSAGFLALGIAFTEFSLSEKSGIEDAILFYVGISFSTIGLFGLIYAASKKNSHEVLEGALYGSFDTEQVDLAAAADGELERGSVVVAKEPQTPVFIADTIN